MEDKLIITCSIVLFKENLTGLHNTINSFLQIPLPKKLYLIDNTSTKFFEYVFIDKDIEYVPIEQNIGFGSAHNRVINQKNLNSKYHLILNPDVSFKIGVISNLIKQLEKNEKLSMIAPKVLYPNGSYQNSCRRYPSVLELAFRRVKIFKKIVNHGIYNDKDLTQPFCPEYLTGCFHLYKTEDLVALKGFDERYFLYMEDVDICKKIDASGKQKLYHPKQEIVHVLKQGSSKSIKLFFIHLISAIKYFRKWGIS
ncbi:glycosyl transferase family 2 [Tenacibaculum holothuriorum]|uniref:Glycosyl transferase family 2 n=1 Tax=Tenacibaculum holothuriorum TaxID=1635173 RepID=A0A1Y2PB45_9FLAO|nr:glycosyltransferase [Tenacibaculum holothuriorum]OSY87017.1 glycosyl transferase family 2 [Tenacibaculum holothuriorum]